MVVGQCHDLDLVVDRWRRWKYAPNQEVHSAANIAGLTTPRHYVINSLSCRGPEPDPDKPTILFLGCSCMFGSGIDGKDTLPELVALRWPRMQCVNGGTPGYGLFQCLSTLVELEIKLKIVAIVLKVPEFFRYPWTKFEAGDGQDYDHHTWQGLKDIFSRLHWEDPRRFKKLGRLVLEDSLRIIDAITQRAPTLGFTHETTATAWERRLLEESQDKLCWFGPSLRSRLLRPFKLYYHATEEDSHPNRAYNLLAADEIVGELDRIFPE